MQDSFVGVFSKAATAASEQGHVNLVGKIVSAENKKILANKLNLKLDKFKEDVANLIIGTGNGLHLTKERGSQEHPSDFTGGITSPYKALSQSWLDTKEKYKAPPDFFVFSKIQPRKNKASAPQRFLGDFLNERLNHSSTLFGKVQAKDIRVYTRGEELKLRGGALKKEFRETEALLKKAGGTHEKRIHNFSPKDRKFEIRVGLIPRVPALSSSLLAPQYMVANLIDPDNNSASGFARSKLSNHAAGRPNVGALLLWYYQVKLPAVIRKHYRYTKFLEV